MASKFVPASQVLNQAYEALQRGDRHEARYWAQIAASMVPNMEDPWLILAAVPPYATLRPLRGCFARGASSSGTMSRRRSRIRRGLPELEVCNDR